MVRSILFGDFRVDGIVGDGAETFHVFLYTTAGLVVARQAVSNNGRYRFTSIPNGEYVLVVENDSREVARMPFLIFERANTDLRRDIQLEWRSPTATEGRTVAGVESYKRSPENQARFESAQESARKKEFDKAISLMLQVANSDAKDFIALTELGTLYSKNDKASEAEKYYLRALTERPAFFLALLNLGKLRLGQKNFDGSIEVLTRALESEPKSADANYLLGEAYLGIKKGSKAVGYLNEAIKLDPLGKAEAHLRLAALYNAAGAKDRAVVEFEQFLAKKPDYPQKKELEKYIQENKKR
jgi:tetratricopeptide (TPR) repeat protein